MLVLFQLIAGVLAAFSLVAQPAKAYVDPGSGAVLWQLLFASIVSIGFHFRKLRRWIFKRWPRRE
jgi:diacylglycerol kinase